MHNEGISAVRTSYSHEIELLRAVIHIFLRPILQNLNENVVGSG